MTKLQWSLVAIFLTLGAGLAETSWGRGFGGMHGGMRGGFGGMRMGGMRPGGYGGMRMGGMRPGGYGGMGMGMRPGGGYAGNRYGGANFAGRRPGGFSPSSGYGNRRTNVGGAGRGLSGAGSFAGRGTAAGRAQRGFPGSAGRGFGQREPGARAAAARPSRDQLGSFLGLPSDGGVHSVAGRRAGVDQRGLARYPDADVRRRADYVRRDFRGRGFYSRDWYRRYPRAWYTDRWAYGNMWAAATWDSMSGWFGYGNTEPVYYDYGNNVSYQDNTVSMNGQDLGTPAEYYQQAETLANTGTAAQTTDADQWMPLGVFAMTHDQHNKANLILQLAVNKEGVIRGNYTATLTNDTQPVHGSVDKKTQRAAWTIGDNKENVIETGIYNLTKDEAPALVHFGKDKTEQWLLVRVKQDEQEDQKQPEDAKA